ncbi:MAG TPA: hypothetical protein VK188_13275 [Holophaga sp.]|nr:hypothetical protein [Holophaga sp.]
MKTWILAALVAAQAAAAPLRAQYDWGYASPEGGGKGTLAILVDPATGQVVLEIHAPGERLAFLQGSAKDGYHLIIPRREVDERAIALSGLSLPFLPKLGSPQALHDLLCEGKGPGVTVTRRDKQGPVKMTHVGKDERGKEITVWLKRTRFERETAPPQP